MYSPVCKCLYSTLCRVAYFGTDADFDIDQTVETVNKAPFYPLGNSD